MWSNYQIHKQGKTNISQLTSTCTSRVSIHNKQNIYGCTYRDKSKRERELAYRKMDVINSCSNVGDNQEQDEGEVSKEHGKWVARRCRIYKLEKRINQFNNKKLQIDIQPKYSAEIQNQSNPTISSIHNLQTLIITQLWSDTKLSKLINLFPLQLQELQQYLGQKKLKPLLKMLNSNLNASEKQIKYGYCQFEVGDHNKEKQSLWKQHAEYMLELCWAVWEGRWEVKEYRDFIYSLKYTYQNVNKNHQLSITINGNTSSINPINQQTSLLFSYNLYQNDYSQLDTSLKSKQNFSTLVNPKNKILINNNKQNTLVNSSINNNQQMKIGVLINEKIEEVLKSYGIQRKSIITRPLFVRIFNDYEKY